MWCRKCARRAWDNGMRSSDKPQECVSGTASAVRNGKCKGNL